jgi:periplasmic protein TonB
MFNDALFSGRAKRVIRLTWLTLPLSLLLHVLFIAGLVVVPLLRADSNLPQLRVIRISTTPPPAPLVPSKGTKKNGGAGGGKVRSGKDGKTDLPNTPVPFAKLQVPYKVPETIEEDWKGIGNGTSTPNSDVGIPEGIDGVDPTTNPLLGVDKGEMGKEQLTALHIANVQMPRKIREVKPVYSPIAIAARIQGTVIIEAMTDVYGHVRQARVISGHPLLNESALEAIKQWLYEPYILNGIPKPVLFTVTITFTLAQ